MRVCVCVTGGRLLSCVYHIQCNCTIYIYNLGNLIFMDKARVSAPALLHVFSPVALWMKCSCRLPPRSAASSFRRSPQCRQGSTLPATKRMGSSTEKDWLNPVHDQSTLDQPLCCYMMHRLHSAMIIPLSESSFLLSYQTTVSCVATGDAASGGGGKGANAYPRSCAQHQCKMQNRDRHESRRQLDTCVYIYI